MYYVRLAIVFGCHFSWDDISRPIGGTDNRVLVANISGGKFEGGRGGFVCACVKVVLGTRRIWDIFTT